MKRLLAFLLLVLALVASASNAAADSDFIPPEAKSVDGDLSSSPTARPIRFAPRFTSKLEPLEELRPDQQLRLKLTVFLKHDCDGELKVSVITKDGLVYDGPESWTVNVKTDQLYRKDLSVTIPNNDTSTIHIILRCEHWGDRIDRHFVTTTDTVEYWETDPRSLQKPPRQLYPWGPTRDSASAERREAMERGEQPYFRATVVDSGAAEKSQLDEMRDYEKEPLTDAQVQYHSVGKDLYRRLEGEKEFTLVKRMSAEESKAKRQAYLDSLAGLPPNAQVRVCLNLRGHHLEFVEKRLGPLDTPESESYYHLTVTRVLLEQLREQGVPIMYLDLEDIVHKPHPSER